MNMLCRQLSNNISDETQHWWDDEGWQKAHGNSPLMLWLSVDLLIIATEKLINFWLIKLEGY